MSAASRKAFEVFVSKIPWTVSTKELKEYFGQFGNVRKCLLLFDKETGFHRGFCWVGFANEEGLQNALQKDPHVLEGTKLLVQRNRKVIFERRDK
ncbi:SRA stem-loop-interacting RNA-binding protein, mitochondrial [Polypterus senegalus]|uniref:SRA stem-loop-interacting RNA-binding protein, mitochondrial n=1 Tax=Polypterus senegalus TaxID=55291 RepID=UPI0019658EED|nr:SRA stem-loop-interacting RNA-binding protein, mitochondrial [Polypterus senegalus]